MAGRNTACSFSMAVLHPAAGGALRQRQTSGGFVNSGSRCQSRLSGLLFLPAECRSKVKGTGGPVAGAPPADPQRPGARASGHRRFPHQTLRTEDSGSGPAWPVCLWGCFQRSMLRKVSVCLLSNPPVAASRSHARSQRQRLLLRACVGDAGSRSAASVMGNPSDCRSFRGCTSANRMCRRSPNVSSGRFRPSWSKRPTW